ncbi:hypothetical protein HDU82_008730 [Entophlyctis luteolus]|nr:hypothetical protein HDU82_008730 [Entophlyctis luteolus]
MGPASAVVVQLHTAPLSHTQRVQRLYRASLRTVHDWIWEREELRIKSLVVRDYFEANRYVDNPKEKEALLDATEQLLAKFRHPTPFKYFRVVDFPDDMSKKVADDAAVGVDKSKLDELSLEIYEARVRDLAEKLARTKDKCEVLSRENDALGRAQTKLSGDKVSVTFLFLFYFASSELAAQQDIVEFLNIKVREHEEHITNLETTIQKLEEDKRALEEKALADMAHAEEEWHKELDNVRTQNLKYKGELDLLFEFKGRKDELEKQLKNALALLDAREKEYKNVIHTMERKILQDKNNMKKEMLQKVTEAVTNFRRVADQQMAETTKRAIRENMAISAQLQKMSAKTLELIAENDAFKTRVEKLRTSSALLEESEKELAKKNQANQKVIRMLLERLKESDEMLELAYEQTVDDVVAPVPEESAHEEKNSGNLSTDKGGMSPGGQSDEYLNILENIAGLHEVLQLLEKTETTKLHDIVHTMIASSQAAEDIESLKFRVLRLLERKTRSSPKGRPASPRKSKGTKHCQIQRPMEVDLSPVIAALPDSGRFDPAVPIETNSVAVQTLPMVLHTYSSVRLTKKKIK